MVKTALSCVSLMLVLSSCAHRVSVTGMVLRVDRPTRSVLVSHREIVGYMPAMVMPFAVNRRVNLENLRPGELILFSLVTGRSGSEIVRTEPYRPTAPGPLSDFALSVQPPSEQLPLGSTISDFQLTDQSGRLFHLSDFKGEVVAITFIYTRCPLANVCPRLSANFATIQQTFRAHLGKDLRLISITIDPQHDTPEVLMNYAKAWNADPEGWLFATADLSTTHRLAGQLGVAFWPESSYITHTVQTAIVSREGKLLAIVEGTSYNLVHLCDLIREGLHRSS